jgi:hypothetical protein
VGDEPPVPLAKDLLLGPEEVSAVSNTTPESTITAISQGNASSTLQPAKQSGSKPQPAFLQNSAAVQQELQDQLAQMAAQLKRNAQHFSNTLGADKALVEAAGEKLEQNFGVMQTQRVRLRDRGIKSRGQTCFTVMSLVAVVVAFAFMVLLIRFT